MKSTTWRTGVMLFALLGGLATLSIGSAAYCDDHDISSREARQKNPFPPDEKNLEAGKAVYQKCCANCHGVAGKGDGKAAADLDPKPSDLTAPAIALKSDGALFWRVSRGRRPMPAFEKLTSDEQRWLVVLYVRTLSKN